MTTITQVTIIALMVIVLVSTYKLGKIQLCRAKQFIVPLLLGLTIVLNIDYKFIDKDILTGLAFVIWVISLSFINCDSKE